MVVFEKSSLQYGPETHGAGGCDVAIVKRRGAGARRAAATRTQASVGKYLAEERQQTGEPERRLRRQALRPRGARGLRDLLQQPGDQGG